jgi:16S rRNA G966 N2-methylase RsmD
MKISLIKPYEKNAKIHPQKQIEQIANSIKEFGFNQPIVVDKNNVIIIGHGRYEAAKLLGLKEIPTLKVNLTEEQAKAYRLADNKLNESDWNMGLVIEELKGLSDEMFDLTGFDKNLLDDSYQQDLKDSLKDSYIIPPFSIFDTRQGYWQDRKRKWIEYIGDSGKGRDDNLLGEGLKLLAQRSSQGKSYKSGVGLTGTSVFDPVLTEICYSWFCPKGGAILDCFAGGSVRGLIASIKGYSYEGVDLSKKQIEENRKRAKELKAKNVIWHIGDSKDIKKIVSKKKYDMIFSCPPYYDLEVYSDGENDISTKSSYEEFLKDYETIIKNSLDLLKDNRFAVFTVGDIRDKNGFYRGFVKDTIDIFNRNGASFYNDIILINALTTAPLRARKSFNQNRKVTKVHQNVLVFLKGNADAIKQSIQDLPQIHRWHNNVLVFYKGDIEEIKNNYKVVDTGLDFE